MSITSNGIYIVAGTYEGRVFFFNIKNGKVEHMLQDHDEIEVRDFVFHPWMNFMWTAGDDGIIKCYENIEVLEREGKQPDTKN